MERKVFAYCRVSTKNQNIDRQLDSLKKYVESERDIYIDKASGKDFNRPAYQALKMNLRSDDILYVHSLDRLGRNKTEILKELNDLKSNGIIVKILDIPSTLADYSCLGDNQKLMMDMINNVILEVLATFAETERNAIRTRQAEGIASAKAKGKHMGRPKLQFPADWQENYLLWKEKKITAVSLMKKWDISNASFYKLVHMHENTATTAQL